MILQLAHAPANGAFFSAFFTVIAFSFQGKNCLNIWPIILGVFLYAKVRRLPFSKYAPTSLLATALCPIVSEMLFSRLYPRPLWAGVLLAAAVGISVGFLMPLVAAHTETMHKGHTLLNAGVAGGLVAWLFFCFYRTFVLAPKGLADACAPISLLSEGFPLLVPLCFGGLCPCALAFGFRLNGCSFRNYGRMLRRSGYHCDFIESEGTALTLINFGLLGLLALCWMVAVGGPLYRAHPPRPAVRLQPGRRRRTSF